MPNKTYPREFLKLRDRIIEHIAIEEIVHDMHDEGQFPIPNDWLEGAKTMKKWLLGLVELEVKEEKGEYTTKKVHKAVRHPDHEPVAWANACTEFEPRDTDEFTCRTCGWRKGNHDD